MGKQGDLLLIKANPEKLEIVTRYEPGEGENQIKFKHPCWSTPVISNGKLFVRGRLVMAICFASEMGANWYRSSLRQRRNVENIIQLGIDTEKLGPLERTVALVSYDNDVTWIENHAG